MRSYFDRMAACRTVLGILCLAAVVILESEAATNILDGKSTVTSTPPPTKPSVITRTTLATLRLSTTNSPQQSVVTITTKSPKKAAEKESSPEVRQNVAAAAAFANDVDGRSAYVNNHYIPDEPLADAENSAPLYQFLQQKMGQMLASTGSEVTAYVGDNAAPAQKEPLGDVPQYDALKQSHPYTFAGFKHYDDEPENAASGKEQEKIFHAFTTKPVATQELPQPIAAASTQHNAKPTKTSAVASSSKIQTSYGSQPTPISLPLQPLSTQNEHLTRNSTIHMRKRLITFKTVSSASQIIATPLADLMFKFSIGIADPTMLTATGTKSMVDHAEAEETEPGYTGNLDLPQRKRPTVYTQKNASTKKN